MTTQEAMNVLEVVCANFNGNLKDHERIQTALQVIRLKLNEEVKANNTDEPRTPNT